MIQYSGELRFQPILMFLLHIVSAIPAT
ncbi:MAG: hypothetical protein ACJARI_004331, partial [Bacteroidia bacterium]